MGVYVIITFCVTFVVCESVGNNSVKASFNQSGSQSLPDFAIVNIISITECVIGIISNGLLLLVIYKDPLEKLRKASWFVIANLAWADFITSVTAIAFCGNASVVFKGNTMAHLSALFILYIGYCSSFLLLLLFAIERYIAVSYPIISNNYLSTKRTRISCLVCWVLAVIMASSWFIEKDKTKYSVALVVVLEIAVVIMIVIKLLLIKAICTDQSHFTVISDQRRKQRKNVVLTLVILIIVLITTALPYFIAMQLQFLSYGYPDLFAVSQLKLLHHFTSYYFPVAYLNFIANPFVYAWRLPDYRRGFLAIFWPKRKGVQAASILESKHRSTIVETRC